MKMKMKYALTAATIALATSSANAAAVAGWSVQNGLIPTSNLNTASPTLGDSTTDSAQGEAIYATIPTVNLNNVGDKLTFTGVATYTGITATSTSQVRWGIMNVNGNSGTTGWLGYVGANGSNTGGSRVAEKIDTNTSNILFIDPPEATILSTGTAPGSGVFMTDGAYSFSISLERTATGIQIDSSLIRNSDSFAFASNSILDTTLTTSTFDRVALLSGGTLGVELVQYSNLDATFTVIPEPSSAVLGLIGALGLLRRRR